MDPLGVNFYYYEEDQMKKCLQLQHMMELMKRQQDEYAAKQQRANNHNFNHWRNDYQYYDWSYQKSSYDSHYNDEQPCPEWSTTFSMNNEPKKESTDDLLHTLLGRIDSYMETSSQRFDKFETSILEISSRREILETHSSKLAQTVRSAIFYDNSSLIQDEVEEKDEHIIAAISTTEEHSFTCETVKDHQVNELNFVGEVEPFQELGAYCDPFLLPLKVAQEKNKEKIGDNQPHDPKIEWSTFPKRQRYNFQGIIEVCLTALFAPLSAAKIDKMRRSWRRDKST